MCGRVHVCMLLVLILCRYLCVFAACILTLLICTVFPGVCAVAHAYVVAYAHMCASQARRGLRQELEHQNVKYAQSFLDSFAPLHSRLESLQCTISSLEESCDDVTQRISKAQRDMEAFTVRAKELNTKKSELYDHADQVGGLVVWGVLGMWCRLERELVTREWLDVVWCTWCNGQPYCVCGVGTICDNC